METENKNIGSLSNNGMVKNFKYLRVLDMFQVIEIFEQLVYSTIIFL